MYKAKGILGGFSGTVGSVVGGSWKGIEYMRSKPTISKNRIPSQKQLEQQAKFAVAVRFSRSVTDLLMDTFSGYANQMTGINKAVSDILKRAITGTYPTYDIMYSKVFISRGSLANTESAGASGGVSGAIEFSWTNGQAGFGKAQPTDKVLMVAYCPELNRAVYSTGALRSAGNDTLTVSSFRNKVVQTWLTFLSADGRDVSDSLFTGEVTVTD